MAAALLAAVVVGTVGTGVLDVGQTGAAYAQAGGTSSTQGATLDDLFERPPVDGSVVLVPEPEEPAPTPPAPDGDPAVDVKDGKTAGERARGLGLSQAQRQALVALVEGDHGEREKKVTLEVLALLVDEPAATQQAVLEDVTSAPETTALLQARALVTSAGWSQLDEAGRQDAAKVFNALTDRAGRTALVELANSGKLEARDAKGGTLLTHLAHLADPDVELHPVLEEYGVDGKHLLESVLLKATAVEAQTPTTIHQGRFGVCGLVVTQYPLAQQKPGEYGRVINGLASPQGRVQMAGGGFLRFHEGYFKADIDRDARSLSGKLFQNAAIEFANGAAEVYDPLLDRNLPDHDENGVFTTADREAARDPNGNVAISDWGVNSKETALLASRLFGEDGQPLSYTHELALTPEGEARALEVLSTVEKGDPQPIFVSIQFTPTTGHVLDFSHIEGDTVVLRDPMGPGTIMGSYPSDAETGFVRMPLDDFKRDVSVVTFPSYLRAVASAQQGSYLPTDGVWTPTLYEPLPTSPDLNDEDPGPVDP